MNELLQYVTVKIKFRSKTITENASHGIEHCTIVMRSYHYPKFSKLMYNNMYS